MDMGSREAGRCKKVGVVLIPLLGDIAGGIVTVEPDEERENMPSARFFSPGIGKIVSRGVTDALPTGLHSDCQVSLVNLDNLSGTWVREDLQWTA